MKLGITHICMAYEGVNNYCHSTYDWSIAKENPSMMYVQMGEETDSAYQVVLSETRTPGSPHWPKHHHQRAGKDIVR